MVQEDNLYFVLGTLFDPIRAWDCPYWKSSSLRGVEYLVVSSSVSVYSAHPLFELPSGQISYSPAADFY